MYIKGQVKGTEPAESLPGTYRSSSALRSSWSRGSCCPRPRSRRPRWTALGCSHLWGWQKEPNFGEMRAEAGARAGADPGYHCRREGGAACPAALPGQAGGPPECASSTVTPHMPSVLLSQALPRWALSHLQDLLVIPPVPSCFPTEDPYSPFKIQVRDFFSDLCWQIVVSTSSRTPEHWCV